MAVVTGRRHNDVTMFRRGVCQCIQTVEDQVHQHLLQVHAVAQYDDRRFVQIHLHSGTPRCRIGNDEVHGFPRHVVHVHGLSLWVVLKRVHPAC
jgi:hypothetical protein